MITEEVQQPSVAQQLMEHHCCRMNDRASFYQDRQSLYFDLSGNRGKKLPYSNWRTWKTLYELGNQLYHEVPTLRSMIEKMISYVVSDHVTYSVTVDPSFRDDITDNEVRAVRKIVSVATRDPNWHRMQEETIRRKFRDGEFFRWVAVRDGKLKVRFIEPPEIRPDGDDLGEKFPFGINYLELEDGKIDATVPVTYTYLPNSKANSFDQDDFEYLSASVVQHSTFGVDQNDPRGIPLGWLAYCQLNKLQEVNEAMCELAMTQASFAAIRTYASTERNAVIDAISRNEKEVRDTLNDGRPEPGRIVDAKGFDIDLPGTSVNAKDFVEILGQQFRIIGGLLDMPEHISSAEADTGNRSTLISAEGPFDRRTRREQTELGNYDIELIWKVVDSVMSGKRLKLLRDGLVIASNFQSAIARDPDKQADTQIKLTAAQLQSKRGAIAKVVGDPDVVLSEIEQEQDEQVDVDLSPFLSPNQRGILPADEQPEDGEPSEPANDDAA